MADDLKILGSTFPNTIGIKVENTSGTEKTYSPNGGGQTINNQNKTVTPTTSQQTVTYDSGYTGLGRVTVNRIPTNYIIPSGTYSITQNGTYDVTNYASASVNVSGGGGTINNQNKTVYPTTSTQSITADSGYTGLGTVTVNGISQTNLIASNIKNGVTITISNGQGSLWSIRGTYTGGGGSSVLISEATVTPSSASNSISFTSLLGEPTSFVVISQADLATGASPWKTAAVVYDGTNIFGQTIRNTSNAQVSYDNTAFSKSYSNGTLTVTGSGTQFQANNYYLIYSYGGSASNIHTSDVQVGSGATSITFNNLEGEPLYWSCVFKSNFSTSSGYQRVIGVICDSQNEKIGMSMDSAARYSYSNWSSSYSNGSLTITSSGTNAGGYFHQPGYYQLTYAISE